MPRVGSVSRQETKQQPGASSQLLYGVLHSTNTNIPGGPGLLSHVSPSLFAERPLWPAPYISVQSYSTVSSLLLLITVYIVAGVLCGIQQARQSSLPAKSDNALQPRLYVLATQVVHSSCWPCMHKRSPTDRPYTRHFRAIVYIYLRSIFYWSWKEKYDLPCRELIALPSPLEWREPDPARTALPKQSIQLCDVTSVEFYKSL